MIPFAVKLDWPVPPLVTPNVPELICDVSILMSAPVAAVTRSYASTVSYVIVFAVESVPVNT
jgi:hypothetical protein